MQLHASFARLHLPLAKRLLLLLALAAHGASWAAGSGTLQITATVVTQSNCKFKTTTANTLSFAIDPSATADAVKSVQWTFVCNGSDPNPVYAISADGGLWGATWGRKMRHQTLTTTFLPYQLSLSPQSGTTTKGTIETLTITGTVLASDFQNAVAGSYSDTVQISLTP